MSRRAAGPRIRPTPAPATARRRATRCRCRRPTARARTAPPAPCASRRSSPSSRPAAPPRPRPEVGAHQRRRPPSGRRRRVARGQQGRGRRQGGQEVPGHALPVGRVEPQHRVRLLRPRAVGLRAAGHHDPARQRGADPGHHGTEIGRHHLLPGDLVFFRDSTGDVHHVGMSLGGDKFIHAPHTGDVVKISSLNESYYADQFTGGRRFAHADAAGDSRPRRPTFSTPSPPALSTPTRPTGPGP